MGIIILFVFIGNLIYSSDVIELNTKTFNVRVLGGEETFFVMLYTSHCSACHSAMPELEKVASSLKPTGLSIGRVNLDKEPSIRKLYDCHAVPKFLLFRPKKSYIEYQSFRTARHIATFILEHQLGMKQIFALNKEDRISSVFNETGLLPRVVLFSHKASPPPVLKQLCFKHRKKIMCWFATDNRGSGEKGIISKIRDKFNEVRGDREVELGFPSVHSYDRMQESGDKIMDYKGKLVFDKLDEFFTKVEGEREKALNSQRERKGKKKENINEEGNARKVVKFELSALTESAWDGECVKMNKVCVLFMLSEKNSSCTGGAVAVDEHLAQQKSYLDSLVGQMYSQQGYTFLWSSHCFASPASAASSDPSSPLVTLLSFITSKLPTNTPSIVAVKKGKVAYWVVQNPLETGSTDAHTNSVGREDVLSLWTFAPTFLDRLVGGDIHFKIQLNTEVGGSTVNTNVNANAKAENGVGSGVDAGVSASVSTDTGSDSSGVGVRVENKSVIGNKNENEDKSENKNEG